VIAINVVNPSDISDSGNGAVILTNPDPPTSLASVSAITNASKIGITWSPGVSNGGTPVLDYRISWDQGTNSYVTLISLVAATTYTTTQTLTSNTVYKFKVESRNAFGYSTT
jgi:hypothetical protein